MKIQWYPGHMTKARRAMQEDIKLVDLVIELLDARVPLASRNPEIGVLAGQKKRLILLNKGDLANEQENARWVSYFAREGHTALVLDAREKKMTARVVPAVMEICREKLERDARKGILNRPIRAMVAGIPNVGKSTFINSLAGKASAKTGNKPGVTKGNQWIRLNRQVELLDTPGILWPKFEDERVGELLAYIGSVKEEILNTEELAVHLLEELSGGAYSQKLTDRYGLTEMADGYSMLETIAAGRGALKRGGQTDAAKGALLVLDDFRSGRLGRITLESCPG